MKKKYELYAKRQLLVDKLPLEAPLGVHICPSTFCNFHCFYCNHSVDVVDSETGKLGNNGWLRQSFMDMELYNKIIEQLKQFNGKIDTLNFAWLGEPLMHPNISDMISIAKKANVAKTVSLVTNGSLLSRKMSDKLIDAGLDRLRISLQGLNATDYYNVSKYKIDYEKFVDNIAYFYQKKKNTLLYIKIMDVMLKTEDDEKLYKDLFEDKSDRINIEYLVPINNVEGVMKKKTSFNLGYYGNETKENKICSYPFFMIVISPFGDILPCTCSESINEDGKIKTMALSNVNVESIKQYWEGNALREFRRQMIAGNRNLCDLCKNCGVPKYHMSEEDRLDDYVNIINSIY